MNDRNTDRILAEIVAAARRGRLDRRGFMEGVLATGAGVTAATALWSSGVAAQTPRRGGLFRAGLHDGNTSDSLDPATTESVFMIQLNHATRSYLTEITETNGLGPDLATSWQATDDAAEWRFELARGASFHSGRSVTAGDVVASLNYHRGEDSRSAAKALLANVTDIRADGDSAVIITLSGGNADLPYLLSDYHLVILPATDGGIDWQSGDGSGPFRLANLEPGVSAELERNDDWFREGPWFDAVRMVAINDPNARQTALLTGDVDAVSLVDLKTVDLLQRAPGIAIDDVPSGTHVTLPMFCDVAPFDDLNVRLALKHAIDRQDIIDKILSGRGSLGNDHPIAPSLPYHAGDLPQREYDPDRARHHLREAGMEGLRVQLSTADSIFSGAVEICVLFAEHARAAGIEIEVIREPNDGYWSNVWLKKPFCLAAWGTRPTPDVMFSLAYQAGAEWNESHWENARFNELLLAAKSELDDARRAEMYREMQLLCRDDGGTVIPFFSNRVMARRDNVMHGPNIASNWEMDGARAWQRWWFA